MERGYKKMDIVQFGRILITSGDLDPVYIAMVKAPWDDQAHQARFLIAYWCFYHVGFASYAADHTGERFWDVLDMAAVNEVPSPLGGRWPRSSERRHARGAQGIAMVNSLRQKYAEAPEAMVEELVQRTPETGFDGPIPYEIVAERASQHTLFGPWISFKIADMVDRVLGVPVDFDEAAVFMFKDPTKAALRLWRDHHGLPETAKPKDQAAVIHQVVEHLKGKFADLSAPPFYDRPIDLQEVETVLCKWKSHMNGHYPPFNDIVEIRGGLDAWEPHSETARALLYAMPRRHT